MKIAALLLGLLGSALIVFLGFSWIESSKKSAETRVQIQKEIERYEELERKFGMGGEEAESLKRELETKLPAGYVQTPLKAYGLIGLGFLGGLFSLFVFKSRIVGALLLGIAGVSFFLNFIAWLGAVLLLSAGILTLAAKRAPKPEVI